MDRYNRAYRDPGSPLTPLTPLTTHVNVFNFDPVPSAAGPTMRRKSSSISFGQHPNRLTVPQPPPTRRLTTAPQRFSRDFMRTRSVFSPTGQSTMAASIAANNCGCSDGSARSRRHSTSTSGNNNNRTPRPPVVVKQETQRSSQASMSTSSRSRVKQEFKHGSPVEQPTLSPRVRSLLNRTGNQHLTEMFTRQEIDIEVLIQMTLEDLEALGVRGAKELKLLMNVIKLAKSFF